MLSSLSSSENLREGLVRLTVKKTWTPPSPPWRGFPLKRASSVCLPAEAARFCRSCWGRSYLSSWLASPVRNRNRGEHIRMSFVIKAGNGGLWIYLRGCTRRHRPCVWHFRGASPIHLAPRLNWHKTRMTAKSHTARHHSSGVHSGEHVYSDGGVKYVISEQLALFYFGFFSLPHKSFTVSIINTNWVRK